MRRQYSFLFILGAVFCGIARSAAPIFPEPQQWKASGADFAVDHRTPIIIPAQPSAAELRLATMLAGELADRYGAAVAIERSSALGKKPAVVMGTWSSPLVAGAAALHGVAPPRDRRAEGYVLAVDKNGVLVAGNDDAGAFHGLQSLRQIIRRASGGGASASGVTVHDWPTKTFRGIKIFLPGRDHLPYFRRFVTDFMALYKFNKLIVELNAGMRFERHPELNAGWFEFARDLNMSRRDRPAGPRGEGQDSAHHDTADGAVLEKEEVAALVRLAEQNHIEVIPEIPCLTHSYYLLTRHRELAEIPTAEWPDAYCPSNSKSYDLLFDVFDEYIEVMRPRTIHVGHDEWRAPIDVCPRCRGKDPTELFIADLHKIHDYLSRKNIRTAMWGDHLIEPLRGKRVQEAGREPHKYMVPGALSPEQVIKSIPKDILMFNWFWGARRNSGEESPNRPGDAAGEVNDIRLERWGFEQVYGNFKPGMENYEQRRNRRGVLGGAPSAWAATTEFSFGKDLMYEFLGAAPMLWSERQPGEAEMMRIVQGLMPEVRRRLSAREPPSALGDPIRTIELRGVSVETRSAGVARAVPIGEDPSSIIFVHAAAKPAKFEKVARYVYNEPDTNDLLAIYDVVYEDGLVESVPVRYAWNILEGAWPSSANSAPYCYAADAQPGASGALFAYEWVNPRLGKVVKEVRLRGAAGARDLRGKETAPNSVLVHAVKVVAKRSFPEPVAAKAAP